MARARRTCCRHDEGDESSLSCAKARRRVMHASTGHTNTGGLQTAAQAFWEQQHKACPYGFTGPSFSFICARATIKRGGSQADPHILPVGITWVS